MNIHLATPCKGGTPIYILFVFILNLSTLFAQPAIDWDHTYGGDGWEELNSIVLTPDGGYLLGGYAGSGISGEVSQPNRGIGDFWILKTDGAGLKIWDKRFGGDSLDNIWSVILTQDQHFLLIGESNSQPSGDKTAPAYGKKDFWVIKTDLAGNKIWDHSFGGSNDDWPAGAAETQDGGFIIAGYSDSPADGNKTAMNKGGKDIWIVKIASDGSYEWDKSFGGSEDEQFHSIIKTSDGNLLLGGATASSDGDVAAPNNGVTDFWLLKINPQGDLLWEKNYGGDNEDVIIALRQANDGGYWLAGGSQSGITGDKTTPNFGGADYWLVKTDSAGNYLRDWTFGGNDLDKIYGIQETQNGFLLLGGISGSGANGNKTDSGHGDWDFWMVYLNPKTPTENKLWDKTIGGMDQDALTDMIRLQDGSYLLAGNSRSGVGFEKTEPSRGLNDFWVLKTNCPLNLVPSLDTIICSNESVTLNAQIPNCLDCEYLWTGQSNQASITVNPFQNTDYEVVVVNNFGCEKRDTFQVKVHEKPSAMEIETIPLNCFGDQNGAIILSQVTGGKEPYVFTLDGIERADGLADNLGAGNYAIAVQDANGCSLDSTIEIPQPEALELNLGNDTILALGESLTLMPYYNQPIASFSWSDSTLHSLNPVVQPEKMTLYELKITNNKGCTQTDALRVFVRKERHYFAPNIFSPNGDGVNDYFTIFGGKYVDRIEHLKVYDRWGELVYEQANVWPGQFYGWDGYFRGHLLNSGVYLYYADITYLDGLNELIHGTVTIVR